MEAHDQHDDRSPFALLFCRRRMLPTFELRIKIASLPFPSRELGAKRIAKESIVTIYSLEIVAKEIASSEQIQNRNTEKRRKIDRKGKIMVSR